MGNASSIPRDHDGGGQFEGLENTADLGQTMSIDREERNSRLSRRTAPLRLSTYGPSALSHTFRRQTAAESTSLQPDAGHPAPSDEMVDEQEERPLVGTGDLDMTDVAPIARTTADRRSRRRSTMSRLGSRFLPDSVARGLLNSGEETAAEGRALRHGASLRMRPSVYERQSTFEVSNRFSLTGSIRRRGETRADPRRRVIRGPFPLLNNSHQLLDRDGPSPASFDDVRDTPSSPSSLSNNTPVVVLPPPPPPPVVPAPPPSSLRRRDRLSRVRDSLSLPSRLSSLFGPSSDQLAPGSASQQESPTRPGRVTFADESDHLLPPLSSTDPRLDFDDSPHELDAVEAETRNALATPRITSGMSTIRRFPHGLRSRSTRLIRRGEHPPLSQVLQLAAAAIAAQLSGHATGGAAGGRPLGGDAFDGSIQNFVQTLQDAATAQAGENLDVNAADGELPPVNFMRVFQFPNDENGSPITSQAQSHDVDQMDLDSITAAGETTDRSVTLVLVGVRSLPHGQDGSNGEGSIGPSLDTLLSLPFLPPANVLRNGSSGALFRRSDARTRSHPRRHSMTNFSFPAQYESQRHQRTRTAASTSWVDNTLLAAPGTTSAPTPISESPPGPHPPPSTPADLRSGQATPNRRPSSASATAAAAHGSTLPDLDEDQPQESDTGVPPSSAFNAARQRRRSDSEFGRRPDLGSGAARRNGVVEPDHPPAGVGRSWLIYVVGTNVSPDHPAFTMPSLFTDNPSYEDMQMLSTLLGPVKPPVATEEDVSSAGGVFRLVVQGDDLIGEAISNEDDSTTILRAGDRCLICLCDYEASEEIRRLNKCRHVFHRECIDEVRHTSRDPL